MCLWNHPDDPVSVHDPVHDRGQEREGILTYFSNAPDRSRPLLPGTVTQKTGV
jgi:hypothetical protein